MVTFKEMSKENRLHLLVISSIIAMSILAGIYAGSNEAWFDPRNFTAGYMAGSLLTVIVLFAIYRSISFFLEKKND